MSYSLVAVKRSTKGPKTRSAGQIPAVIYGADLSAESLALEPVQFKKMYSEAGSASLIDMIVDGKDAGKALVQEVQYDPISGRIVHVDFRRINMNKEMTANVALRFVGEVPVIKASGGTLVMNISEVEVKCLPKDLVSHIDIDVTGLTSFDHSITIKDIKTPAGIKIISPAPEALVAKPTPALTEDEIKAMEEASKAPVDLSKIESATKKKEADEEAAPEDAKKDVKEPAKKETK
jgi:large subunit ribosomal protein L25